MRFQTLIGKKRQQRYGAVSSILCLAFCVAIAPETKALHQILHSHQQVVSHNDIEENDPCHRAIYHNGVEGCHHPSHFAVTDQCSLCNLFFHTDQFVLSECESIRVDFLSTELTLSSWQLVSFNQSVHSSRAPPVL